MRLSPPFHLEVGVVSKDTIKPEPAEATKVQKLANGLRVLVEARKGVGVVALQAWVQVGRQQVAHSRRAHAHVHEHMVFKGTKRFEQGLIDNAVASLRARSTLGRVLTRPVYHLVLPNEATETDMQILAEARFSALALRLRTYARKPRWSPRRSAKIKTTRAES